MKGKMKAGRSGEERQQAREREGERERGWVGRERKADQRQWDSVL